MNVPVEVEIPEGWEPVAVRVPKAGDWILAPSGPCLCEMDYTKSVRLILRRKFVWPPWLTAGWIARDANGGWCGYEDEPVRGTTIWEPTGNSAYVEITDGFFDIQFPDLPWRESKMRNPHGSDPCSGA